MALQIRADLTVGNGAAGDLREFVSPKHHALAFVVGRSKEIGKAGAKGGQNLLERGDRWAHAIGLDHRDCRIGYAGAARDLTLRQAEANPQLTQALPYFRIAVRDVHMLSI